jgi:hypothetical protein
VTRWLALAPVKYDELVWSWHDCTITMDLKMRIHENNVLSSETSGVWGSEGWLLTGDPEEAQQVEQPLRQPHHGQDCT